MVQCAFSGCEKHVKWNGMLCHTHSKAVTELAENNPGSSWTTMIQTHKGICKRIAKEKKARHHAKPKAEKEKRSKKRTKKWSAKRAVMTPQENCASQC